MITIRYKELSNKKYSIYLDYFVGQGKEKKRKYEFLRLYVSKDYSKSKRVLALDKEKVELAGRIRSKRELEIYGIQTANGSAKATNNLSFSGYIGKLLESPDNIRKYKPFTNKLQGFTKNRDIAFSQITVSFIEDLFAYIQDATSRNSAVKLIGNFKTLMNRAYKEGLVSYNPFDRWKIPVKTEIHRVYLELHELKMLNACDYRWNVQVKRSFLFSCFTGLRFSDIKKMKYKDFKVQQNGNSNLQGSTGNLQDFDITLDIMPLKTKGTSGKLLSVPLSSQAQKILDNDCLQGNSVSKEKLVFGGLPNNDSVNLILKDWAKEAGLTKNLHFHAARHTFATLCLTSGIDIYTVSKLLGHSSIENTEVYARILEGKLKQEVQKFHSFL